MFDRTVDHENRQGRISSNGLQRKFILFLAFSIRWIFLTHITYIDKVFEEIKKRARCDLSI